jgi:hypothetical protein
MATKKSEAAEAVVEMLDEPIVQEVLVIEEEPVVAVVDVEEAVSNPYPYLTVRAFPSDNYLTIAERHLPEGKMVKEFADEICEFNRCASVRPGAKINIPN